MEALQALLQALLLLLICSIGSGHAAGASGECIALKNKIQEELIKAQESGGFVAQEGSVNLSLVGIGDEFDCSKTNCAFSNPNSAYSFGLLPLAPEEDFDTKTSGAYDLPEWGTTGLNGEEGFEYGLSPYWQLRGDEVVMAFGCTPPGASTRFFSFAPYIRGVYSESRNQWVEISGSMEDGKGIVREPNGSFGFENRLKTSADQNEGLDLRQSELEHEESAFDKITVVLMGASASSTENAKNLAIDVLEKHGLVDAVNIMRIPEGFGEVGLADENYSKYSYYSLLVRYILDSTGVDAFNEFAKLSPMNVWRLTPSAVDGNVIENRFGPSPVVSRKPEGEDSDNELYLADALEALIRSVEETYKENHAVAHTIGGQSLFDSLGIDYGKECLEMETNICYYEAREATYFAIYPAVRLDIDSKFIYMVGVNHRVAGTAMYNNAAANNVEKQIGIASLDDIEIYGSAELFLRGTEFEHLHTYLYAIQFSRSCEGREFCTVLNKEGGRSVLEDEQVLLIERIYVKPQTGVGPDLTDVLPPHAMTFTPWSVSEDKDSVDRLSSDILETSICVDSYLSISTCQSGVSPTCCNSIIQLQLDNCFCSEQGQAIGSVLGANLDSLRTLLVFCGKVASPC